MRNHEDTLTRIRLANPEHAVDPEEMAVLRAMIDEEISAPSPRRRRSRSTERVVGRRVRPVLVVALAAVVVFALFLPLWYTGARDSTRDAAAPTQPSAIPSTTVTEPAIDVLGLEWRRVEMPGLSSKYLWFDGVVAGGPGLIAVGSVDSVEKPFIWTSTDGTDWTPAIIDSIPEWGWAFDVTAGGPGYVAVGSSIWTSPDGITWRDAGGRLLFGELHAVAAGGPGLVAVGQRGGFPTVWTSPDGLRWSQIPEDGAPQCGYEDQMLDIVAGGPGLVAVGQCGGIATVWTSPDGFEWTPVPHDPTVFGDSGELASIAVADSGFVAVGHISDDGSKGIWRSDDGLDWSVVPLDTDDVFYKTHELSTVITTEQGFIAGGSDTDDAGVWFSPDGITWTRLQTGGALGGPGYQTISDITVFGDSVVAVGMEHIRIGENEYSIDSEVVWIGEPSQK